MIPDRHVLRDPSDLEGRHGKTKEQNRKNNPKEKKQNELSKTIKMTDSLAQLI